MVEWVRYYLRWLSCYLSTASLCPRASARTDRRAPTRVWLQYDVIVRVALLSQASLTCALAWLVPSSLTYVLLREGGPQGGAVKLALLLLLVISWLDIIVNDLAPASVSFRVAKARRHLLYSALGALYLVQAFASVGDTFDVSDVLSVGYIASGLVCAWYSFAVALRGGYE
jgi:hypothetical protein